MAVQGREASCSVVLQLNHAVQISTVHIGAHHAALVEVLVGRSETPNDQYEVLVPSSVFLSPLDSRRGAAVERVRSFGAGQLAPAGAQRWDRVRVVCSQPYNKHCKYGLSFVHVFEAEEAAPSTQPAAPALPARVAAIGNYSSDEEEFRPGELFAKHRQSEGSRNTEAQIRQASSQALRNINDSATRLVKTPIAKPNPHRHHTSELNTSRQKNNLIYTEDDELPHAKIDSIVKRHKDEKEQETRKKEAVQNIFKKDKERTNRLEQASKNFKEFLDDNSSSSKESPKDKRSKHDDNSRSKDISKVTDDRRNKDLNSSTKDGSRNDGRGRDLNSSKNKDSSRDERKKDETSSRAKTDAGASGDRDTRKRQHSDERQKEKELRPGPVSAAPHTLLADVVFALSGYENPRRARLRDSAVAMGARFERDWSPACTHLICAFPNTPKLRAVRNTPGASCAAVRGEWLEQCCGRRRRLPWRWFATEPRELVPPPPGWQDEPASECDTDDEIEKVIRKQKKQRTNRSPSPRPTSPRPQSSRDLSPVVTSPDRNSPKPQTSREKSPTPQTSREKSPKPQTSREKTPKPQTSREKSPKPQTSREKSPKPQTSREKSPKPSSSRDQKLSKKLNYSNISSDSDVTFVKDERIQANITIDSGESTDEDKPAVKERIDKKRALPDFFDGYTFVIEDSVEDAGFDKKLLSRYVKAYGGVVLDAPAADSEVSFVLCAGAGRSHTGLRVRADWLWRCHGDGHMVDVTDYTL